MLTLCTIALVQRRTGWKPSRACAWQMPCYEQCCACTPSRHRFHGPCRARKMSLIGMLGQLHSPTPRLPRHARHVVNPAREIKNSAWHVAQGCQQLSHHKWRIGAPRMVRAGLQRCRPHCLQDNCTHHPWSSEAEELLPAAQCWTHQGSNVWLWATPQECRHPACQTFAHHLSQVKAMSEWC